MSDTTRLDPIYPFSEGTPDVLGSILRRGFAPFFRIYIWLVVVLPSGSVYGVNFKLPLYVFLVPSALYVFLRRSDKTPIQVGLLVATPAVFSVWVILSQLYQFDVSQSLRHFTDVLLTVLTCWLGALYCTENADDGAGLLRTIVFAEASASALKSVLVGYAVARGIPIIEIAVLIDKIFNVQLMSMDIDSLLGRLQFVSDGLIPICMFAVLAYRHRLRIGIVVSAFMMAFYTFSVVLSFSRYFWGFSAVALMLGLVFGKKDKLFWSVITMATAATIVLFSALRGLFTARFSTELAGQSDVLRVEQIAALKELFLDAPFFGHGLGSYSTAVIRSDTEWKFAYEVQLLALAGQVGIVGLGVFAAYFLSYFRDVWPRKLSEVPRKGATVILLAFWLAAGLFNPLLLNPVGAFSYVAIFCVGLMASGAPNQGRGVQPIHRAGASLTNTEGM